MYTQSFSKGESKLTFENLSTIRDLANSGANDDEIIKKSPLLDKEKEAFQFFIKQNKGKVFEIKERSIVFCMIVGFVLIWLFVN